MKITTKMAVPKREELPPAPVACCSWPNLLELKLPYNPRKRRKLLDRLIPE